MLYHLLYPLSESISAFNVFRYLTFRSVGATLTALLIAFLLGPILIQAMRDRNVGQTIREDTPDRHQAKSGTPTFGGLLILLAVLISTLLWSEWTSAYVWIVLAVTLGFGLIGFVDDYEKAVKKNPQGIRARTKIILRRRTTAPPQGRDPHNFFTYRRGPRRACFRRRTAENPPILRN